MTIISFIIYAGAAGKESKPDPRVWSCFSLWVHGNRHPSSASLAESSPNRSNWKSWGPRRGGGDGSLGNWWHSQSRLSSSLLLPLLLLVLLVLECMGNAASFRGVETWLVRFVQRQDSAVVVCFWPSSQFEPGCFLILTCCSDRDENVFLFHYSLWIEFPC